MNDSDNEPAIGPQKKGPSEPSRAAERAVFRSEELFRGANEILIEHKGETYRLRCTRLGKLILQK